MNVRFENLKEDRYIRLLTDALETGPIVDFDDFKYSYINVTLDEDAIREIIELLKELKGIKEAFSMVKAEIMV